MPEQGIYAVNETYEKTDDPIPMGLIAPSGVTVGDSETITDVADGAVDSTGTLTGSGSGGGGGRDISTSEESISLASGEIRTLAFLPAGSHSSTSLGIYSSRISTAAFTTPTGLEIQVYDSTNSTVLWSSNQGFQSGSPITSITVDGLDIELRMKNGANSTYTVSGGVSANYE